MRRWYVWMPICAGLLGLIVWRTQPWTAVELSSGHDAGLLLLAIALNVPVIALWAVRSRSLMAAVGSPLGWRDLVPVVSFANTVNNLTPASSGEVLRAVILKQRHGVPYGSSAAVILAERFWAIGILLVTAAAAALGPILPSTPPQIALGWLGALVLAFGPTLAYRGGLRPGAVAGRLARHLPWATARRLGGGLAGLDDRMAIIVLDGRRSIHFVLTTGLIFVVFAAQLWLVLEALGAGLPLAGVWAANGLAICAGVISALPFGLGAADAVLVILLVAQGVQAPVAGAAALLIRSVATLPLGLAGTASWAYLGGARTSGPAGVRGGEALDDEPAADGHSPGD